MADDLGFGSRFENSMDAVSDRDFVAEALFDLALLGVHLSRMGEELVLWTTDEFGFATFDDAFATGSSMLPQKKNPDVAELARGKSGRLIGNLTGLLATLKGLPLSYNRDLQEDKEPLFDSVVQSHRALAALSGVLATVAFDTQRMREAADGSAVAAIDLAEWLVEQGMPFRQAHAVVGGLVSASIDRRVPLAELVEGPSGPRARSRVPVGAGGGGDPPDHTGWRRSGRRQGPARALRHPGGIGPGTDRPEGVGPSREAGDRAAAADGRPVTGRRRPATGWCRWG